MPVIEWVDALSVNVQEIDEQHRGIIGIINDLHDALLNKPISEMGDVRTRTLSAMSEQVAIHFATEEAFMARIGYPGLGDHQEKHVAFIELLDQYQEDVRNGILILNSELMKTLANWFVDHELEEDQKFSSFHAEQAG